jgi:hypothetical protein
VERDEYATIVNLSESAYLASPMYKKVYSTYKEFRESRLATLRAKPKFEFLTKDLVRYYYPVVEVTYVYVLEVNGTDQLFVVDLINYVGDWKVGTMFNYKGKK